MKEETNDNVQMSVQIEVLAPFWPAAVADRPVSGTNVNVSASASAILNDTGDPDDWEEAEPTGLVFKIAGTDMPLPPIEPTPSTLRTNVRFASTHFADNTQIVLRARGTYLLSKPDGEGGTYSMSVILETQVTVRAHNVLIGWGTVVNAQGQLSVDFANVTNNAVNGARTRLAQAGHSHGDPASDAFYYEPELRAAVAGTGGLRPSTFFYAMAHGDTAGIWDSGNATGSNGYYAWTEVQADATAAVNNGFPRHNYGLLYVCSGLASDRRANLRMLPDFPLARAIGGFDTTIGFRVKIGDASPAVLAGQLDGDLYLHSHRVLDKLLGGFTFQQAVSEANAEYMPRGPVPVNPPPLLLVPRIPMEFVGFGRTRLKHVWLENAAEDAIMMAGQGTTNNWWFVTNWPL